MPIKEAQKTIHTKVLGVTEETRQSILLAMYNKPEDVIELLVNGTAVTVLMELDGKPAKICLGHIKQDYFSFLQDKGTRIKQWKITGGEKLEGYMNRRKNLG